MKPNQKLIIHSSITVDTPIVNPPGNPNEPYRVIWNPSVILGKEADYVETNNDGSYKSTIKTTAILTDFPPMSREPLLLTASITPIDINVSGYPLIVVSRPTYPITGMRINHISDFAGANRRGILPKVFQGRFIATDEFAEMDLYRYNLDSTGDTYIGARIVRLTEGDYRMRLVEASIAGASPVYSDYSLIKDGTVSPDGLTDTIRFVVFENKLALYMGEPGELVLELPLRKSLLNDSGAYLEIIREDYREDGQPIPVHYGIDGLYIYDGYF